MKKVKKNNTLPFGGIECLRESISKIEDPKLKEVETRLLELNEKMPVGIDPIALTTKICAMYEIYKDVYGDEIGNFTEIMNKVNQYKQF
jgi:hypothetical protein